MATITVEIEPESRVQKFVVRIRPYPERSPVAGIVPEIVEDALHLDRDW